MQYTEINVGIERSSGMGSIESSHFREHSNDPNKGAQLLRAHFGLYCYNGDA